MTRTGGDRAGCCDLTPRSVPEYIVPAPASKQRPAQVMVYKLAAANE